MTTKKKTRRIRATKHQTPRYATHQASIPVSDEETEQSWIVFALGLFVLLGIGFISAISYILLLG